MVAELRPPLAPVTPLPFDRADVAGLALGPMIRRLRLRTGLSQNQLAHDAGCDPAYVNRIERAAVPTSGTQPSRKIVLKLWEALAGTPDDRERMLVAAGHCPEAIVRAGGWDGYVGQIRQNVARTLADLDRALAAPLDGDT